MAIGEYSDILKSDSLTAQYLKGEKVIAIPAGRRPGNGKKITLKGCTGNNLKNVSVDFPLGKFICVTGVSGSGKSSLINGTLHPILSAHYYNSLTAPLPYASIQGVTEIEGCRGRSKSAG